MCGIAGIVRFDDQPIDRPRAEAMLAHMSHRGPDASGISEHPRCTLAHARLSIIDQIGGAQPMHGPRVAQTASHGPLHLVFNGEIYNHRELRTKLEKCGHRFTSDHSDTETLLLGYREWGTGLPEHLRGMFAFTLWDEDRRELFLARDRAGKKPLYLHRAGNELVFASLAATITAADPSRSPAINPAAMLTYLRLGYPFADSMIQGIEEVPAAHWMMFDAQGKTQTRCYWRPSSISRDGTSTDAMDRLGEVLTEAVGIRLEADVPLGCFLSGGIDSSLIAALAQQHLAKQGGDRLRTFSVAMPDIQYDEAPFARAVADHIGSEHTELLADPVDLIADLEQLISVSGEPTADSGLLPSYWLCKAARPHVKVALSGDGGDELFGGYDRYRAMALLARYRNLLRAIPRALLHSTNPRSARCRLGRLVDAARAGAIPPAQYASMIHLFTDEQIADLAPSLAAGLTTNDHMSDWPDGPDVGHAAMRWDRAHYLPYELLRKVDRSSMAVALEVRCPMLDTQVVELAGGLPRTALMPGGRPKGLLRQLSARYLPDPIVRRPKRGFAVPIGRWFREDLKDALADRLTDPGLEAMGLNPRAISRYLDEHTQGQADHGHRLFALLQLSLWSGWLREGPRSPGN